MRGGTGRLSGRDDEWDPGLYKFIFIFITRYLYGSGKPCKHLLQGRDGRQDDFGVLKYMTRLKLNELSNTG
jgi:hypothetical protein